jgi:hypothetical protein
MWPSRDVPAPNGMMGTWFAAQILTIEATSSVERGKTTACGGALGWYDSSLPCVSNTAGDVVILSSPSNALKSAC